MASFCSLVTLVVAFQKKGSLYINEKSWRICISQLSKYPTPFLAEIYKHVWTCSHLKLCRSPALAPFKTPSASPASTAACAVTLWHCDAALTSKILDLHFPSKHPHPSISALAKRTVNCAVPGDLPLLLFASLCAVQAPGKHGNDRSCYAISNGALVCYPSLFHLENITEPWPTSGHDFSPATSFLAASHQRHTQAWYHSCKGDMQKKHDKRSYDDVKWWNTVTEFQTKNGKRGFSESLAP